MIRALLLVSAVLAFEASAVSFDCSKANSVVEKMICSDPSLSTLDDTLASAYENEVAKNNEGQSNLRNQQKAWLSARNRCLNKECLRKVYETRIRELACADRNLGSTIGAGSCFDLRLREAELSLVAIERQFAGLVVAGSNNPEYAKEVLATESEKWRDYRNASCALYGEMEGGSDGWKNAWATDCSVKETRERIDGFRKKISALRRAPNLK